MGNSVPATAAWRRRAAVCLLALLVPAWTAAQANKLNPLLRHVQRRASEQPAGGAFGPAGAGAPGEARVKLFLRLRPGTDKNALAARYPGARFTTQAGTIVTGEMPLSQLRRLDDDADVLSVEASVRLEPTLDVVRSSITAAGDYLGVLDPAFTDFRTEKGSGVIVGIVDSGIDWRHHDFMVAGSSERTRILYIWDQADTVGPDPGGSFAYGTEWTQALIDDEIDGTPTSVVRSTDAVGHGTHVAGIAAGNGAATDGDISSGTYAGMAPDAELIIVKTTLENTEVLDGVNYIFQKAAALGKRAVVNLSLGSDFGPHDGTDAYSVALEAIAASSPVVMAAGNSRADGIHASLVTSPNDTVVFGIGKVAAADEFQVDFWIPSGDLYTVSVATSMSGGDVASAVAGLDVASVTVHTSSVSIYNAPGTHPSGDREVLVVIGETPSIGPDKFYITFTRTSNSGSGKIDGWIAPAVSSFTTYESTMSTISSDAAADSLIVVGSYCGKREWTDTDGIPNVDNGCAIPGLGKLSDFSGIGPTRDGRVKPDITAPGEYTASSLSADSVISSLATLKDDRHAMMLGTSMAAPVVTGMAAIELQRFSTKTAADVKSALLGRGRADSKVAADGVLPNSIWGHGKATHFACSVAAVTAPTAVTPTSLGHSSISFTWGLSDFADSYNLYYATDTGTLIANVAAPSYILTGLLDETTYAIEARGVAPCGEGPGAVSLSTPTGPLPPLTAAPPAPVGTAIDPGTIHWTWNSLQYADSYDVVPASDTSAAALNTALTGVFHTGLASNTAYGVVVGGRNDSGRGPLSPAATAYTAAAPPVDLTTTAVHVVSVTFNWSLNGNPGATLASMERSTDGVSFAEVFLSSAAIGDQGLLSCTSHYYRVRNRNGDGILTAYSNTVNFMTHGSTPTFWPQGFSAKSVAGRRVALSWLSYPETDSAGLDEGVLIYEVYYDNATGTVDYSTTYTTVAASALSYTTDPLPGLESAYKFAVRARNRCGVAKADTQAVASAVALEALAGVRADVTVPVSGTRVDGDRVTAAAELSLGSSAQTRDVRFEFKAASDTVWSLLPAADPLRHPNPDPDFPYAVHWNVLALDATSYNLRAVATDIFSGTDAFPMAVTVVVDHAAPDIRENLQIGIGVEKQVELLDSVSATVETADELTSMVTRVVLPARSIDHTGDRLIVRHNRSTALNAPVGVADLGIRVSISLHSGQEQLANGQRAVLTFGYPDANGDHVVDGTPYRAEELKIYAYDLNAGVWRREFDTSVDTGMRTVTGSTPHFSWFAVFAPTFGGLESVRVYPNPYRPGGGDPNDGALYSSGDQNSGIVFDHLPADYTIRIYTLLGERVAVLRSAGSGGRARWDVSVEGGGEAASGVYFAVISSPSRADVVRKVAVIR